MKIILRGGALSNNKARHRAHRRAEHLMIYNGRGLIGLASDLIKRFFRVAPVSIRGYAIEFVGWSLGNEEGELPQDVVERLRSLWESRISAARTSEEDEVPNSELVAFGSWFVSGKLESTWALEQLHSAIEICGWTEPDHMVVEALAECAGHNPRLVIECVQCLIGGDVEGWRIHSWRDALRTIFGVALSSGDAGVASQARSLINRLGERGFFEFGDLLA